MYGFDQIISYILCTEYIILQDRTKNPIYILQNRKKLKSEKMNRKPKINQKDTKNESETKNKPKGYKK